MPIQMLALPKSPNSVIDEMLHLKRRKQHRGSLPRSSWSFPSRVRSRSSDGSKSTITMSSGGRSYKSVRSDDAFKSTKSLSTSLRDFRIKRQSRQTKALVRKTKGLELWDVCEHGQDLFYLEHTIDYYPGLIHLEQRGRTPLFVACANGHTIMAARLLEAGAQVDEKIYKATTDAKCRALLDEYRVVERALSMGTNDNRNKRHPNEEEESYETPQMANLSSCRNVLLPKSPPVKEEEKDDFFSTGGDFSACSTFGHVEEDNEPEEVEEDEEEMDFWMSRGVRLSKAPVTLSKQQHDPEGVLMEEASVIKRQASLVSIAPSESSEQEQHKVDREEEEAQKHCNCSFVECPGMRHDSPVQDTQNMPEEDKKDEETEAEEPEEAAGLNLCQMDREAFSPDTTSEDFADSWREVEVSKIPDVLPNPSAQPRRLFAFGRADDDDVSPAAAAVSISGSSYTTASQAESNQEDSLRHESDHSSYKPPSPTISFSSSDSEDTESQQSQTVIRKVPNVARQPPFVPDEHVVEQAIECTFVPVGSSSRSLLPSWRPLRRNRRDSESCADAEEEASTTSQTIDNLEEDELSTTSSTKRRGTVEMTLKSFTDTSAKEEATRQGLFQRMRKRSHLRRKVSKILDDTESAGGTYDDNSAFSSHTHSTFFPDDCCDPRSCCI